MERETCPVRPRNNGAPSTFFPTIPTAKPITSFATISNVYSVASSNFNGVVVTRDSSREVADTPIQL